MFGDFSELRNAPTAIPPYPVHVRWDEGSGNTVWPASLSHRFFEDSRIVEIVR